MNRKTLTESKEISILESLKFLCFIRQFFWTGYWITLNCLIIWIFLFNYLRVSVNQHKLMFYMEKKKKEKKRSLSKISEEKKPLFFSWYGILNEKYRMNWPTTKTITRNKFNSLKESSNKKIIKLKLSWSRENKIIPERIGYLLFGLC